MKHWRLIAHSRNWIWDVTERKKKEKSKEIKEEKEKEKIYWDEQLPILEWKEQEW